MKKRFIAGILSASVVLSTMSAGCSNSTIETTVPETLIRGSTAMSTVNVTEGDTVPEDTVTIETVAVTAPEAATEPTGEPATEATSEAEETEPTTVPTIPVVITEPESEMDLTSRQRNSLNMLNYMTVLTQSINESSSSRIYLESVQSSLLNNIYPNAVDRKTQERINEIWKTIDGYRMISLKRERLAYIYEQNRAQALRQAIPNPLGLLSTIQSGSILKAAASVIYMAVDAKTSYDAATTAADMEYLQDGWELDDAEASQLSDNQLKLLNYMLDMVRENDFPGEYALTEKAVKDFVKWANEENLTRKINWLESKEETYCEFRTYWLELAKAYYEAENYEACLQAFEEYEKVATRIFRKDSDYAEAIPVAIVSAKNTMSKGEYVEFTDEYVSRLLDNCDEDDWMLRYFAAQIYIDLYAGTAREDYLWKAYEIVYDNVNVLVDEQENLNAAYLAEIEEAEAKGEQGKKPTKREKEEVKEYNKYLKETRKKELPPVSEAFYLNCDLLFALADKLDIPNSRRSNIDNTIHEDGNAIFLTEALDSRFWASKNVPAVESKNIEITFNGAELIIPANCLTDRSTVKVTVSNGDVLDDWIIEKVDRPKDSTDCSEFTVKMSSEKGKGREYAPGEEITICVTPVADAPDETLDFVYNVAGKKNLWVFDGVEFERVQK